MWGADASVFGAQRMQQHKMQSSELALFSHHPTVQAFKPHSFIYSSQSRQPFSCLDLATFERGEPADSCCLAALGCGMMTAEATAAGWWPGQRDGEGRLIAPAVAVELL